MTKATAPAEPDLHVQNEDRRYFFDITDVADFVRRTPTLVGIPRVTIAIIKSMAASHGSDRIYMCLKDRGTGKYICMTTERLREVPDFSAASIRYAFGMTSTPLLDSPPTLEKYEGQPIKQGFHSLTRRYRAFKKDEAYFQRRGSTLAKWNEYQSNARRLDRSSSPAVPTLAKTDATNQACSSDELVLLGALWDRPDLHDTFQALKNQGLRVTLLLYDLIPISAPEIAPPTLPGNFLAWLERACGYTDQFLAISQHSANEMAAFLEERGLSAPITVVSLAQELPTISHAESSGSLSSRLRVSEVEGMDPNVLAAASRPFVLCVGTLEIRKNNLALAQAWSQLARDHSLDMPRLVFAGKPGWNNDAFFEALEATGNFEGWVHVVRGPTDAELGFLYSKCEFTAMVSLSEGWGLPIGESLSYGKTAVVAANTSMPEVGGDMVEYCDATSVKSIAAASRKLIEDTDRRAELETRIKATRLRTWNDVLQDFIGALESQKTPLNKD